MNRYGRGFKYSSYPELSLSSSAKIATLKESVRRACYLVLVILMLPSD
jgi:hypothetical protein